LEQMLILSPLPSPLPEGEGVGGVATMLQRRENVISLNTKHP
jgi:hypothetical protein